MKQSKPIILVVLYFCSQAVFCQFNYQNTASSKMDYTLADFSQKTSLSSISLLSLDLNSNFRISTSDSVINNPRLLRPLGLSLYGGSPAIITSISLDYYITPGFSIDAGGGLFGVYTGFRFHLMGKRDDKNWTPNTGLLFAVYGEAVGVDYLFFIPVGLNYTGPRGFNFAPEILIILDEFGPAVYPVWFGVKVGYRFKRF